MKIEGLIHQFRNESSLRFSSKEGARKKAEYTREDVDNFVADVKKGVPAAHAAKIHGIPSGTAHGLKPDDLKKKRNRPLAIELIKKKLSGTVNISFAAIGRMVNYEKTALRVIKVKVQAGEL